MSGGGSSAARPRGPWALKRGHGDGCTQSSLSSLQRCVSRRSGAPRDVKAWEGRSARLLVLLHSTDSLLSVPSGGSVIHRYQGPGVPPAHHVRPPTVAWSGQILARSWSLHQAVGSLLEVSWC